MERRFWRALGWPVALAFLFLCPALWAYSGGTGEPNNPYQIATVEDLIALGNEPNDYNDCFILTADIDLSGYVFDRAVIAPDEDDDLWGGYHGTEFSGCFNGQGHVIRNLAIQGQDYLGLFGCLTVEALVLNLGVEDVEVIAGNKNVYAGGLVGVNDEGTILSSFCTGTVSGHDFVGGLVGYLNGGQITASYSRGIVSGSGYSIGGLVGYHNSGQITCSYSCVFVDVGPTNPKAVGGLVGETYQDEDIITSSFWDIDLSGLTRSDGGLGLSTVQMQEINTYLDAGWDFVNETSNGTCNYWSMKEGAYPCLAVFSGYISPEPNGSGTQDDPYLITDANDLGTVWFRPGACYRLGNDIDLMGITWNSAVVPGFTGRFDGDGHVIENLRIEGGGYLGLFGRCLSIATLSNLGLDAVDVNGIGDNIGGLVGENKGLVTRCYSTGAVKGDQVVSGLVGFNREGTITLSYSSVHVSGNYNVGGLVGRNYKGRITSSYSSEVVSGIGSVGGLVGV